MAKPSYLKQKDFSGTVYQCPNPNDTKAQPFPTPLTSCHLISQRRLRTSILSLLQYFNPVDAENTSTGREGITPGWNWAPQGIERCLWQEAGHCSVPNSCCLRLFPSFSTPLSIICEFREKPQNWLQTGQEVEGSSFCRVPHQDFCRRNPH